MIQRLWRAKRWIRNSLAPHALILMYHRVTRLENDPHLLAVTPEHFAAHLEVIREDCSPVSLPQLVQALMEGRIPRRAVVITFDDGYADNLHHAKPLLERYGIPATVFVTAGHVGSERELWWDELDRLLLQPGTLPSRLRLRSNGSTREWDLGEATEYTRADYLRDKDWHIEREDDPTARQYVFRELFSWLPALAEADKHSLLDDLRDWAGVGTAGRRSHYTLTAEEIGLLEEGDLIEVGAHTMTHPHLARLPLAEQTSQIQESRRSLDAALKKPVRSFAFPNGSYTRETISILRESGFICACTSNPDAVWQSAGRFELPRLGVRNWDRDTFAHWLRWWMDG